MPWRAWCICEKLPSIFWALRFASHSARGFRTASRSLASPPFAELPLPADIFGVPSFTESNYKLYAASGTRFYFHRETGGELRRRWVNREGHEGAHEVTRRKPSVDSDLSVTSFLGLMNLGHRGKSESCCRARQSN